MPTTVTKSIGTSGRDYTTIQAWEDASPADLVAADQIWRGECYNDSEFTHASADIVIISGVTSDATRYRELTAAAGQSFKDHASVRTNPLTYDQTKGVGLRLTGPYFSCVNIKDPYVRVSRLQMKGLFNGCHGLKSSNIFVSKNLYIKDCLIVVASAAANAPPFALLDGDIAVNVVVVVTTAAATNVVTLQNIHAVTLIGCTIVRATDNAPSGQAIFAAYASNFTLISCAVFGFTTLTNGGDAGGSKNNATDLASGLPGTSNQHGVAFSSTTPFTSGALATLDMRAKSGTALANAGFRDSTNGPNDISGFARSATPTIGVWELFSGTAYTATLTGALASSGTLVRADGKTVSGIVTSSGTATRSVQTPRTGTLPSVGALVRATMKTQTGTVVASGALASTIRKTLTASMSASGTVVALMSHHVSLAGVVAGSGALWRDVAKGLAGTVTLVGALGKAVTVTVRGTLAAAGRLGRLASLVRTGVISAAGTTVLTYLTNRIHSPIHIRNVVVKKPGLKSLRRN